MLGKLLKYDLRWVYKVIVVFYILSIGASVLGRLLSLIDNSFIFTFLSKFSYGFAVSMVISALINSMMRLWARFIRNIYKDESYLTHTLPVEKGSIYLSKVIAAVICIFTTVVVAILSLFICYYSEGNMEVLKAMLQIAANTYNVTVLGLLLVIFLLFFVEFIFIVILGYVGIILGHKFNKGRIVKSVVISFGLYLLTQAVTGLLLFLFGLFNPDIMNLINTTGIVDIDAIKLVSYLAIIVYGIYAVIYYMIGLGEFKKGVNVE